MTRADLKHCRTMPDTRADLNRSVREVIIESRHSTKSLEGMGSSSHVLGAEIRVHSFTVNCDTFSNEEKVAAVVPLTSVEVTCSEAMLAVSSMFLYFVGIVFDENTGKVSTRVSGWQYFRRMPI